MSDILKTAGSDPAMSNALRQIQQVKSLQQRVQSQQARGAENTPGSEGIPPKELEEMKTASVQFEGLMLQQLFKSMWKTVPKDGMLTGSREEELYRDMLNESLATDMAQHDSLGIRDVVMKELVRKYTDSK